MQIRLQKIFIRLMLQLCFVWSKDESGHLYIYKSFEYTGISRAEHIETKGDIELVYFIICAPCTEFKHVLKL